MTRLLTIAMAVAVTAAALSVPTPASAAPDTVPGEGVYRVGVEIAPGTYKTAGTSSSICSWTTAATLGSSSDILDGNASTGQLYAQIPASAAAFETHGCLPWTRVS